MKHTYDVIVLGVGSMGSATCYHLAKRGLSVLGLEQFSIPHDQGSHAGQSRIIRKAYFEHPDYVPLLELAYKNWRELEALTGEQVYHPTGLLYWGDARHEVMKGVMDSSRLFGIPVNEIPHTSFPQLSLPPSATLLMEPDAGFLTPERAVRLYVEQARRLGGVILEKQKVLRWEEARDGVIVYGSAGVYHANKLVITAGPWAAQHIPALSPTLTVTKQVLAWVMPEDPAAFSLGNFPCWMAAEHEVPGVFYGFPMLPETGFDGPRGFKLAHHTAGVRANPDAVDRTVADEDLEPLIQILQRYFKGGYAYTLHTKTCLYTNTPDEHFVIDQLPGHKHVSIAAGFSGHGFKFASGIGEVMAELAVDGRSSLPVDFLSCSRAALG